MSRRLAVAAALAAALLPGGACPVAGAGPGRVRVQAPDGNLSLRLEIEHHLDRGAAWFRARQDPGTGGWGGDAAGTGLALTVLMGTGRRSPGDPDLEPELARGYAFLGARLAECDKPAPARVWVAALPALYFLAERPEIRALIRTGLGQVAGAAGRPGDGRGTPGGWEEEFRRREVLQGARQLGLAELAENPEPASPMPRAPGTLRERYLEAVVWRWQGTAAPAENQAAESWRAWASKSFPEHLQSSEVCVLEAMAKALLAQGVVAVRDPRGGEADWREKLAVRLFDLQRRDGSWGGENPAMDTPAALIETTGRALLALQTILKAL